MRKITFAGGVEKFAKSDRLMAVTSEIWDRDPFLLGTPDGTVDLRTGNLREPILRRHHQDHRGRAGRDPIVPRWLKFLDETFGDPDLIRFIQQWNGYCLTGDISEHALVFGFGNGGNGKGVWLNTSPAIMADYATTAAMETFTASKYRPASDRTGHAARRADGDGERNRRRPRSWAESRIKQLTGGDPITARFMQKDFFTFQPNLQADHHRQPQAAAAECGRGRPPALQPHPLHRTPAKIDKQLGGKAQGEWPGILRWMIDGCLDWQANGLVRPESVIAATESYFDDQDLMAQWLSEECDVETVNKVRFENRQPDYLARGAVLFTAEANSRAARRRSAWRC